MRIAIVHPTFYVRGGAENVVIWLAGELLRRGHDVTVFTSEHDPGDPDVPAAVAARIVDIGAGGHFSNWLDWQRAGRILAPRLRGFDVVNPHNFPANAWVHFAHRRSAAFPPVVWYCQEPSRSLYPRSTAVAAIPRGERPSAHRLATKLRRDRWRLAGKALRKARQQLLAALMPGRLLEKHRALDQAAAAGCDLILGNSDYMTARIRGLYGGRGETCRLGVPASTAPEPGPGKERDVFLAVSRLEPLKHVDEIVRAYHRLAQREPGMAAPLVIAGTGSQEPFLRGLARELGLGPRVVFAGRVSDAELAGWYRRSLAVVTVPEDEAFGLVPLEAMRHGAAVIAAREGGMAETVEDGVTGLLVEPRDLGRLAEAMHMLLRDRKRAEQMGERGRGRAAGDLSFAAFVDRFEERLASVRKERGGPEQ